MPDVPSIDGVQYQKALHYAREIQMFWMLKGFRVNTWVKAQSIYKNEPVYCIRSDMVNGYPKEISAPKRRLAEGAEAARA